MINKPNQFDMLYRCNIESFKKLVHKPIDPLNYYDMNSPISSHQEVVEFVNIKMTMDEYERFNQNWDQYLTLMIVARDNPRIKQEYHKLLMMVNLLV